MCREPAKKTASRTLEEPSNESVLQRILTWLETQGCPYELLEHRSVSTAREAASARATNLDEGAKAILLKYDADFAIFVLSASLQVRSALIRRGLRVKRTRFAFREELLAMTGLQPGSVPPFGKPVLPFPLFADPSIERHPTVVFTAGSRTTSLRLATADYLRVARPQLFPFARS